MADTLANVKLEPNVALDLNTATGIAVGTAMIIQNVGPYNTKIIELASGTPNHTSGYNTLT